MRKIKSLFLIGFLLNSLVVFSQVDLKNAPRTKYITSITTNTFLISTKPITNREYIIYLLWIYNVSGTDYPESIINAIPGILEANHYLLIDEFYKSKTPFEVIFKNSSLFVKDYIFNPRYIDYPIIGLSRVQASRFCKWLSDRYNENKLIKLGYFKPAPEGHDINENCFVTESYVAGQYYGARIKEETIKWSDGLLIPTFRLPTKNELNIAEAKNSVNKEVKSYDYDTTSFLNHWHQLYLKVSPNSLTMQYIHGKTEVINSINNGWDINKSSYQELTLDMSESNKNSTLIDIFNHGKKTKQIKDYEDIEKDSLGQMPFIIIDENINKEPVIVENYKNDNSVVGTQNKFYFFRFVCNMAPKQYKP